MTTIPQLSTLMKHVLGPIADHLGRETGFIRRQRVFSGSSFARPLVFSWWANPAATCDERAEMTTLLGCPVTAPAIAQRFTPQAAAFLQQLLLAAVRTAVAADPVNIPVLRRFTRVEITDGSIVILPDQLADHYPGCGTKSGTKAASLKLLVRLDLTQGRLSGPLLGAGRTHDRRAAAALPPAEPGSLQVGDLAFFGLEQFRDWERQGVYWLSRYKCGTHLYTLAGQRLDLLAWLQEHCPARCDAPVRIGAQLRLRGRLIAERVPDEVRAERQAALREEARKECLPLNPVEWELARWTILLTNCGMEQVSVAEALGVEQARWQIELLIKRNKSLGQIDEWRTAREWRVLCEVYAKLLVGVLQHWLLVVGCWANPARSLWRGQQALHRWGRLLARAWDGTQWLAELRLVLQLARRAEIDKRAKEPGLWQILLAAEPPAGAQALAA